MEERTVKQILERVRPGTTFDLECMLRWHFEPEYAINVQTTVHPVLTLYVPQMRQFCQDWLESEGK
jgi:hypothetical protein